MTTLAKLGKLESRARKRTAKWAQRKEDLASAAIDALTQLGYARTSLRDIAKLSGLSVGILHYYFEDKTDLIKFCVRTYKDDFVAELDAVMNNAAPGVSIAEAFAQGLCDSIRSKAGTHRLWYDIRSQALFDVEFRNLVDEIEAELMALVSRLFERIGLPQDPAFDAYLALDGGFRYYLQRYLADDPDALAQYHRHVVAQIEAATISARNGTDPCVRAILSPDRSLSFGT